VKSLKGEYAFAANAQNQLTQDTDMLAHLSVRNKEAGDLMQ
jgi:hypothetical protein